MTTPYSDADEVADNDGRTWQPKPPAALAGETRTEAMELKFLTSSMDKVHGNPYFAYGDGTRYDIRILRKGTGYWSEPNELDLKRLTDLAAAASRIAQLGAILPETFFADRDIAFRLERIVDGWRRAMEANHLLETRAETAEAALTQAQQERDRA